MARAVAVLAWAALAGALAWPLAVAGTSPLLSWREPAYVAAGLGGIVALGLLLVQPLLAGGFLPGLSALRGRRVHRWVGAALVPAVAVHVAGLWVTSPPDVIDTLLLRSPAPFAPWGVLALWALLSTAGLAAMRRRVRLRPVAFRRAHAALAALAVLGTVLHALLIEGTMGTASKLALSAMVVAATAAVVARAWKLGRPRSCA